MLISAKKLTVIASIAAIYAAITIILGDLSYAGIQVRISEALMMLCLFRKEYCISLSLGCFIANLFSPLPLDLLFGTMATVIAAACMYLIGKNDRCVKLPFVIAASFIPAIANSIIIGFELFYFLSLPFWLSAVQVALGEIISCVILGNLLLLSIRKNKSFMNILMLK